MVNAILIEPVSLQWTCELWREPQVELQEMNLIKCSILFEEVIEVHLELRDILGRTWRVVVEDARDVLWDGNGNIGNDRPASASGEILDSGIESDRYWLSSIDGTLHCRSPKTPSVRPI